MGADEITLTMTDEEMSDNIDALMEGFKECDPDFADAIDAMLKEVKELTMMAQRAAISLREYTDQKLKPSPMNDVIICIGNLAFVINIAAVLKDYVAGQSELPPNFYFTSDDDD